MNGFIYAVLCAGRIKIGWSTNPHGRMSKLESDAPFPCALIGFTAGSRESEAALHAQLEPYKLHREWFADVAPVRRVIASWQQIQDAQIPRYATSGKRFYRARDAVLRPDIPVLPHGSRTKIAAALNITCGAVSQWRRIPGEAVLTVEQVTGIPHHELRPDLHLAPHVHAHTEDAARSHHSSPAFSPACHCCSFDLTSRH